MLLKFFKRPLPLVLISIILIGLLLWFNSFVKSTSANLLHDSSQMPLFLSILNISKDIPFLSLLFSFVITLSCSLYLIHINSKYILIKSRTHLPALVYLVLSSSIITLQTLNAAVFSAFFLTLSLDHFFASYDGKKPFHHFFMIGFFVAIASIIYLPSSIYLLLFFISLLVIKSFNGKDWVVTIFGFATPWYFMLMYYYLIEDNPLAIIDIVKNVWIADPNPMQPSLLLYIFLGLVGLVLLISLLFLLGTLSNKKINVRKFHVVLLWFTIITGLGYAFVPSASLELIYILAIPLSFQLSLFFTNSKNRFWPELLFTSLLLMAVLMQFFL